MTKKIFVIENMEDLHLDYEYDDDFNEQDENVPPTVEGVVILSEDDEDILDLNATTTLHELSDSIMDSPRYVRPCPLLTGPRLFFSTPGGMIWRTVSPLWVK